MSFLSRSECHLNIEVLSAEASREAELKVAN